MELAAHCYKKEAICFILSGEIPAPITKTQVALSVRCNDGIKEEKMPVLKENTRIIYEGFLGKPVRHYQWQQLKTEMAKAGMPINRKNLEFIANCKRMAPRKAIASEVLENVVQFAIDNSGIVKGAVIKGYIEKKHPKISKYKFYRAFSAAGWNFRNSGDYPINELGEVLYKLFM